MPAVSDIRLSSQFQQFVAFAHANMGANQGKTVARLQPGAHKLGTLKITAAATDRAYSPFRAASERSENDAVRQVFKRSVAEMFGGAANIPASVRKAMVESDYGKGKPLTARRIDAVNKAIVDHFRATLPDSLDLVVENENLSFDKWHFEEIVANMSPAECPKNVDQLRLLLAGRIANGRTVLRAVLHGQGPLPPASMDNVSDITLALHAAGLRHGDKMSEGSFSIEDPQGRLAKWLDTSPDVYLRSSSHLEAYQQMDVDNHRNILRGIDVPPGKNGLMAGMRTVHYGTVPDLTDPTTNGSGPKRRLFLKCESWGAFHNTLGAADAAAGLAPGMRPRTERDGDHYQAFRHTLSFIETRFKSAEGGGARKEHLPKNVASLVKAAQEKMRAAGNPADADSLVAGNALSGGGIRMLLDNITSMYRSVSPSSKDALSELVNGIYRDMNEKHGVQASRLGNEIMIEISDLT